MMPPSIIHLRIKNSKSLRFWFPLFLLWPIILILAVPLLPLWLVMVLLVLPAGWSKPLLQTPPAIFALVCSPCGLKMDIRQGTERFFVSLK